MMDYNIRHGQTYMYFKGKPLYPFGYGMSYTTFAYSNLRASAPSLSATGAVGRQRGHSRSTGSRASDKAVQLYVKHIGSSIERPLKELQGFQRVHIPAGENRTVTIHLPASRLAYWESPAKVELSKRTRSTHGWLLVRRHPIGPHHRNHTVKLRACGGGDDAEEKGAVGRDDRGAGLRR